jgi:hypothetical protein
MLLGLILCLSFAVADDELDIYSGGWKLMKIIDDLDINSKFYPDYIDDLQT